MKSALLTRRLAKTVALAASLGVGLCACPGSLDDPAAFLEAGTDHDGDPGSEAEAGTCVTAADVPNALLMPTCGKGGCHDAASNVESLDFVSPGLASRVVNRPSMEEPTAMLVVPTDPDKSYLMIKISSSMPPFGARMPYLAAALAPEQIQCVRAWIATL